MTPPPPPLWLPLLQRLPLQPQTPRWSPMCKLLLPLPLLLLLR
jgi:hypothetical protein